VRSCLEFIKDRAVGPIVAMAALGEVGNRVSDQVGYEQHSDPARLKIGLHLLSARLGISLGADQFSNRLVRIGTA
jgi:hypothetical protein